VATYQCQTVSVLGLFMATLRRPCILVRECTYVLRGNIPVSFLKTSPSKLNVVSDKFSTSFLQVVRGNMSVSLLQLVSECTQ